MLTSLISEPNLRLLMVGFAALCTIFGFVKGLGRLLLLGLSIAVGAAAVLAWFRYFPGLCIAWFGEIPVWLTNYGALGAGLIATWFARRFLHALVTGEGGQAPLNQKARVRGGLFGFVPALIMLWLGAIAVRWTGTTAELRAVEAAAKSGNVSDLDNGDLLARLNRSLNQGVLGSILNRIDPVSSREAGALGSILALSHGETAWRRLASDPGAGPILQIESFRRLRNDREVIHALSFSHYSQLLALPEMNAALNDKPLREALLSLDLDSVISTSISGKAPLLTPRAIVIPE